MEVKLRSEDQENLQRELLVGSLERQIKELQGDGSDSGVVVHCSTVQRHLHRYDLHGGEEEEKLSCVLTTEVLRGTSQQA